jgi:hypothetical protein
MNVNGVPVNFAFLGTNGITVAGLVGQFELQDAEVSAEAENEVSRNAQGDKMNRAWYDRHNKARLTAVIIGSGLAAAIANSTVNNYLPGSFVQVTACQSMPDLVGKMWEVQSGASIKGSNTNAKRLDLPLEYNPNITGTAAP